MEHMFDAQWSPEVIRKAERLVEEGKVTQDTEHPEVWWVQGSKKYRVQTDGKEWMTCTCPNGQRASWVPSCYHSASVMMTIRDRVTS